MSVSEIEHLCIRLEDLQCKQAKEQNKRASLESWEGRRLQQNKRASLESWEGRRLQKKRASLERWEGRRIAGVHTGKMVSTGQDNKEHNTRCDDGVGTKELKGQVFMVGSSGQSGKELKKYEIKLKWCEEDTRRYNKDKEKVFGIIRSQCTVAMLEALEALTEWR